MLTILLTFVSLMAMEQRAHAYVDPGSSLLMFQSMSAMVTGALFYFRRRLKSLLVRPGRRKAKNGDSAS